MSIYPNVTEQDLINLRNLAEQQKNRRALKIKNRFLKQTLDVKLAESLSPITKKIDEVKESTQNLGEVIEKAQPEKKPQPVIEHTSHHQPIEKIEGVIYDTELENTLKNMKRNTGFFQTFEDREHEWMWNGYPVKKLGGTEVEINDKKFNIFPGIQKVLADTSNIPMKKLNNEDREIFNKTLESIDFENCKAIRGQSKSSRYKQSKTNFEKRNLEGQGVKIIIPSNIIDIYSRFEILLGLNLSGHTDTLTEASILIDELYKRGEVQNQQQYRNLSTNFLPNKMELPSKLIQQVVFITRPNIEEHILIVMDKSTHEEHASQPLQTNI